MTKKWRYFWRLGGKQDVQLNIIVRRSGFGLKTWPAWGNGIQKRAVHFGVGYISWRIDDGVTDTN